MSAGIYQKHHNKCVIADCNMVAAVTHSEQRSGIEQMATFNKSNNENKTDND